MKFKYYLRGVGIGILAATIILMISIHVNGGLFTEKKAIAYAVEHGYVLEEAETSGDAEEQTSVDAEQEETASADAATDKTDTADASADATSEETTTVDASVDAGTTNAPEETAANEAKTNEDAANETAEKDTASASDKTSDETAETEETKTIPITVQSSDSSESVSASLEKAGLVESADDFNEYLKEHDYDRIIHGGIHHIPVGASYEEIALILVGRA